MMRIVPRSLSAWPPPVLAHRRPHLFQIVESADLRSENMHDDVSGIIVHVFRPEIRKNDRPKALEDLMGMIVRAPFIAGEPIREAKLVNAKGSGFMAAIL